MEIFDIIHTTDHPFVGSIGWEVQLLHLSYIVLAQSKTKLLKTFIISWLILHCLLFLFIPVQQYESFGLLCTIYLLTLWMIFFIFYRYCTYTNHNTVKMILVGDHVAKALSINTLFDFLSFCIFGFLLWRSSMYDFFSFCMSCKPLLCQLMSTMHTTKCLLSLCKGIKAEYWQQYIWSSITTFTFENQVAHDKFYMKTYVIGWSQIGLQFVCVLLVLFSFTTRLIPRSLVQVSLKSMAPMLQLISKNTCQQPL